MFKDVEISWLATADPPEGPVDRYIESMQLHRHFLAEMYSRGRDVYENLRNFATYWQSAGSSDAVIVVVSDASTDGVIDVEELTKFLPPGARMLCLLRQFRRVPHPEVHVIGVPAGSLSEFETKVGGHISRLIATQTEGTILNPRKPSFPRRHLELTGLDNEPPVGSPHTISWRLDGIKYDFLAALRPRTRNLVVIGQSALVRQNVHLPMFQRWTWIEDLHDCSAIVLNDPNLYLDERLNAGWWFGTPARDTAREMAELVGQMADGIGIPRRRIVFYGGSAGGFSSFHMAACLPGSRVIADIPQINMRAYHHRGEADRAAQAAFGVNKIADTPIDMLHRVDVIERFLHERTVPEYLYLQNSRDITHVSAHFGYFMQRTAELAERHEWARGRGGVELYSFWSVNRGGHFPMNRADTTDRINRFLAKRIAPKAPGVA